MTTPGPDPPSSRPEPVGAHRAAERSRRRQLVTLAVTLFVAVGGVAAGVIASFGSVSPAKSRVDGSGATRDAPARCRITALSITLVGHGVAAGTSFDDIKLTNVSRSSCSLEGFPRVTAVDAAGNQIGRTARLEAVTTPRPHVIDLRARQSGEAMLGIETAENFPSSMCRESLPAALSVELPGEEAKLVPWGRQLVCGGRGPDVLFVGPIVRAPLRYAP